MDSYNGPGLSPDRVAGTRQRMPTTRHIRTIGTLSPVTFHSCTSRQRLSPPKCKSLVVDDSKLAGDLANEKTTPNLSFIVPNTCSDGHDATCVDGSVGGLTAINKYHETAVPKITESAAFKQDGLR